MINISFQKRGGMWTIVNTAGDIVFASDSYVQARSRLISMLDVIELESSEAYQKWLLEREAEFCTE